MKLELHTKLFSELQGGQLHAPVVFKCTLCRKLDGSGICGGKKNSCQCQKSNPGRLVHTAH